MLSSLRALASTFFLYSVVLGVAVEVPGHFEINAQPKGIDVSAYQPTIDWKAVVNNGVSFAYIKATEGTSKTNVTLIAARSADISSQPTRTLTFRPNTPAPPKLVSFVAGITSHAPIHLLALLKLLGLLPMEGVGVATVSLFQVLSTWKVRTDPPNFLCFPTTTVNHQSNRLSVRPYLLWLDPCRDGYLDPRFFKCLLLQS